MTIQGAEALLLPFRGVCASLDAPYSLIIVAGGMTFILILLHPITGFGASYSGQRALWQGNLQGLQMIHGVYPVGLMITLISILALPGGKCFIAHELRNRVWWKRRE